jgi:hypothetical protein
MQLTKLQGVLNMGLENTIFKCLYNLFIYLSVFNMCAIGHVSLQLKVIIDILCNYC